MFVQQCHSILETFQDKLRMFAVNCLREETSRRTRTSVAYVDEHMPHVDLISSLILEGCVHVSSHGCERVRGQTQVREPAVGASTVALRPGPGREKVEDEARAET